MFEQLFNVLPQDPGKIGLIVAASGSIVGLVLWLCGARYGRWILTLVAVGLGTAIGLKLPKWYGGSIDPMAPAVGISFVLGLSAYALHRFWVGLWLTLILAAWGILGVWSHVGANDDWKWPKFQDGETPIQYSQVLFHELPKDVQKNLPFIFAGSIIVGFGLGLAYGRGGHFFLWSTVGTSMFISMGWMVASHWKPALIDRLPQQFSNQVWALIGAILVGAVFNWRLSTPFRKKSEEAQLAEKEEAAAH